MSSNLVVQIISLALWIFAFAGLEIQPDAVASDSYTALVTANWPLLTIIIVNLVGSLYKWYQTWKTDKPNFILFLRSPNWWVSFANIVLAWIASYGIVLPADAAQRIVEYVFTADWWNLAGYVIPSILGPVIMFFTKKKADAQKALLEKAKRL